MTNPAGVFRLRLVRPEPETVSAERSAAMAAARRLLAADRASGGRGRADEVLDLVAHRILAELSSAPARGDRREPAPRLSITVRAPELAPATAG